MYEFLVNLLTWTAVGAVGYFAVYLVRCRLEDRRSTTNFTKVTYDVAIQRAANNMRSMYHLYTALPYGQTKITAYSIYLKRLDLLGAIKDREQRELGDYDEGYGQARTLVE